MDLASILSSILYNSEVLSGTLASNDVLEMQFNLVNDAVLFLDSELSITKANKSAEIITNQKSALLVGKRISEAFGTQNAHLMHLFTKFGKQSKEQHASLLKTQYNTQRAS